MCATMTTRFYRNYWLCATLTLGIFVVTACAEIAQRSFTIDYDNDTFVMDGKPFRYVSGSFHYFRAHPATWRTKLRTMRAAGLNAVSTYVEWSLHNPKESVYRWSGIADLEQFVRLAQDEDLYVILRPGPYICAERDMGGLPYWLLRKYPAIALRTHDADYFGEVSKWYAVLMPRIQPQLYGNGGPIIMVQVENEYGSFTACNVPYRNWLRNETVKYTKTNALLFTTDGPSLIKCGRIDGVYATIDFGVTATPEVHWQKMRDYEPRGPLVNSEYYPGWLTHWQEPMSRVNKASVVQTLRLMLAQGANVNFYMFFGGTNFGFTAGANNGGPGEFNADVTSYDYDAPMDEAGDPTSKYLAIREAVLEYLPQPDVPVPTRAPKSAYGTVPMQMVASLFSMQSRNLLGNGVVHRTWPLTFEALDQNSGLVLYETYLPPIKRDPAQLVVDKLRDRALVYVDRHFVGVLSRENRIATLPISSGAVFLQLAVENQGRINYGIVNDFKGILGNVWCDNKVLTNWTMTGYPFENAAAFEGLQLELPLARMKTNRALKISPVLFAGTFIIEADQAMVNDTYLDMSGWGKGVAFINNFNLGRYWPLVGPQITLYVPKEILKRGENKVWLVEYQDVRTVNATVSFVHTPNLDGIERDSPAVQVV